MRNETPIVSRLRPDDKTVVVERLTGPPLIVQAINPYSSEEEVAELARYDDIVVADSVTTEGFLVDGGTWIRTRVRGRVAQVARAGRIEQRAGQRIQFELDGGEVMVGEVVVRAGAVPVFGNARYLLSLVFDSQQKSWIPTKIFVVDDQGTLRPYELSNREPSPSSTLHGLNIEEILSELRKRRPD